MALKHVHTENNKANQINEEDKLETIDSENSPNQKGSEVPPVTREETCQGDREGITTHAVVANSARDISVGAGIGDYPRSKVSINRCQNNLGCLKQFQQFLFWLDFGPRLTPASKPRWINPFLLFFFFLKPSLI